jgi:hypothetical protein
MKQAWSILLEPNYCLAQVFNFKLEPDQVKPSDTLYYKHMTIVNDNSNSVSKWVSKLIYDARVAMYNCHMFIIQATG